MLISTNIIKLLVQLICDITYFGLEF